MWAIDIQLFSGRYAASFQREAEWPPHPARLFSALVAVWGEGGEDIQERKCLEWLERQPPPAIHASHADVVPEHGVFVMVNDPRAGDMVLDVHRKRERSFPAVLPRDPKVSFCWQSKKPSASMAETLDGLLARVGRLGHSSSFVSCVYSEAEPEIGEYTAVSDGEYFRWVKAGQLAVLQCEHAIHQGNMARSLPYVRVSHKTVVPDKEESSAGENTWVIPELRLVNYAIDSHVKGSLDLTHIAPVADLFHKAVLRRGHQTGQVLSEEITGHTFDGEQSKQGRHVGFVPLPYVGNSYADGSLKGIAVTVPEEIPKEVMSEFVRFMRSWEQDETGGLALGGERLLRFRQKDGGDDRQETEYYDLTVTRVVGEPEMWTLSNRRWQGASRVWATVSPIALPKHPKKNRQYWDSVAGLIADICITEGLPEPLEVIPSEKSIIEGTEHVKSYPVFTLGSDPRNRKKLVHATILFPVPVEGFLVLGAGKYRGLGLMLPVAEDTADGN